MKKSFLKSKTVHGLKTGNHSNPNVLRAARASGGSCMVEGASAPTRMTKAPRMMRADGGGVQISKKSKDEADTHRTMRNVDLGQAALSGAAALLPGGGKLLRTFNAGMAGMGAYNAAERAKSLRDVEAGKAVDGKEDRKNGGRIMPRFNPKKKGKC